MNGVQDSGGALGGGMVVGEGYAESLAGASAGAAALHHGAPAVDNTTTGTGRRRLSAVAVLLVLLPLLAAAALGAYFLLQPEPAVAVRPATPVVTARPATRNLQDVLRYSGNLRPQSTNAVVPKVSGKVTAIHVGENEVVRAGQLLVSIEDDVVRLQMEQTRAALNAAQAQYEKAVVGVRPEELESAQASLAQAEEDVEAARTTLDRTRRLFEAGTVARARFEEAENQFRSAETQLENARRSVQMMATGARTEDVEMARAQADSARRQFELAQLQLSYAQVRSPIDGVVARIPIQVGSMAGPTTPLVSLINDELIYANIAVPERHYGTIALAADSIPIRIFPIAYVDRDPFVGTLSRVSSVIEPNSRTFDVEIAVLNPNRLLRPGMFVNVEMVIREQPDALVLPTTAVLFRDEQYVVFVVDDAVETDGATEGRAQMIPVQVGAIYGSDVSIVGGITADIDVIVQGNAFLESGQRVRLPSAQAGSRTGTP